MCIAGHTAIDSCELVGDQHKAKATEASSQEQDSEMESEDGMIAPTLHGHYNTVHKFLGRRLDLCASRMVRARECEIPTLFVFTPDLSYFVSLASRPKNY